MNLHISIILIHIVTECHSSYINIIHMHKLYYMNIIDSLRTS